jgi:histidinol phosphatase-like enzyme (inositol monophosphatase family)
MSGESAGFGGRLEFAIALAREGGDLTVPHFYSPELQIERKPDDSFVTVADKEAERLMRSRIKSRYPEDGIVGEEWGSEDGSSGFTWFLDPVDGTEAFVRGVPLYGTLVACGRDERGDIGVIYLPALSQVVYAQRGGGAWWASELPRFADSPETPSGVRRAAVSGVSKPEDACLITTHNEWWPRTGRAEVLARLTGSFGIHRMWGHCYAPFMVATGKADVFVEPSGHDWDFAAAKVVVEEAGGVTSSVQGEDSFKAGSLVVTNGKLHEAAMSALKGF